MGMLLEQVQTCDDLAPAPLSIRADGKIPIYILASPIRFPNDAVLAATGWIQGQQNRSWQSGTRHIQPPHFRADLSIFLQPHFHGFYSTRTTVLYILAPVSSIVNHQALNATKRSLYPEYPKVLVSAELQGECTPPSRVTSCCGIALCQQSLAQGPDNAAFAASMQSPALLAGLVQGHTARSYKARP